MNSLFILTDIKTCKRGPSSTNLCKRIYKIFFFCLNEVYFEMVLWVLGTENVFLHNLTEDNIYRKILIPRLTKYSLYVNFPFVLKDPIWDDSCNDKDKIIICQNHKISSVKTTVSSWRANNNILIRGIAWFW